jgi:hypothetical protein
MKNHTKDFLNFIAARFFLFMGKWLVWFLRIKKFKFLLSWTRQVFLYRSR